MSTSNILFFSVILVRIRNILYIHIPLHRTTQHPLERVLCRYNRFISFIHPIQSSFGVIFPSNRSHHNTNRCVHVIVPRSFSPDSFHPSHPIIVRLSSYFPSNRSNHNTIPSKIRSIFFHCIPSFFPIPVDCYSVAISIVFSKDRIPVIRDKGNTIDSMYISCNTLLLMLLVRFLFKSLTKSVTPIDGSCRNILINVWYKIGPTQHHCIY